MSDPAVIAVVVFVLVAVAVQQGLAAVRGLRRSRRDRARRFASLTSAPGADRSDTLRRQAAGRSSLAGSMSRLIQQSGTGLDPLLLGAIWVGLTLLCWMASPVPAAPLLRLVIAAFACGGLVVGWLRLRRARRMALFAEQLPDVMDIIVRSLRAGHPLPVSLGLAAREMPDPAGHEFTLVMNEVSYGRSLGEALDHLAQRIDDPELRFFVAATAIAQQTGGNLGEILSRLSRTLRARFRLARRVRALSAEGRFSGFALSVLPIALFGLIQVLSRSYYAEFWATPVAPAIVALSIALLVIGNVVIYRLINFKV